MGDRIRVISPVDGEVYVERALAGEAEIAAALDRATRAQKAWREVPVAERAAILGRAVDAFVARRDEIAPELTWQMGRPIRYTPNEVAGFEERARYMIAVAEQALADVDVGDKPGFTRFIRRVPLGVAFVIAPWNYPYLTAVNAVVPALMAGNAVILKHSAQTPLCAERIGEALAAGGLPAGVFQHLHLSHDAAARIIDSGEVDFVSFTGSVAGGRSVQEAAARRFLEVGLELGGKDPAYVRADADLEHAIENLADGAFFNSGQSCCAIERIYVHRDVYDRFVDGLVEFARSYRLDDPTDPATTLGPLVRPAAAEFVRGQIAEAVAAGATAHLDPKAFPKDAARFRVHGAAGPDRRRSHHAHHDRGDVRPGGRRHAGGLGRRGDPPHERQSLWPDRGDLDRGCGRGDPDRRSGRDRHLVHEPLRLPRPGARLDRGQGLWPRLLALTPPVRASHPAEVVPSAHGDLRTTIGKRPADRRRRLAPR